MLLHVVRQVGGAPGPVARGAAMMHAAVHDAVSSIVPAYQPYLERVPANPTASIDAAVAHAAHDVLAAAFPSTTVDLAAELGKALALLPPSTSTTQVAAGKAVGRATARAVISARSDDGAAAPPIYTPASGPGDWRPTTPGSSPATPHWPSVRPFCMTAGTQFRPPLPGGYTSKIEMLRSAEYAAQFNEVKTLGGLHSSARTPDQEEIAFFWANDLDGTSKPPGQLFEITKAVSVQRCLDVVENARLFALVALAMADAAVVAWDAKYATDVDLWRPVTAIQEADAGLNPGTVPDASWEPLSRDRAGNSFTPPFPAYVSGHATVAAAHAAVMRVFFGTDNVEFTATTEDPALPPGTTRAFHSFTEAARENARSRVYLGVHFQWDGDHGYHSGTALGEHVVASRLRPTAV